MKSEGNILGNFPSETWSVSPRLTLEDTSAMLDARGFVVGNHHTGKLGDYVIERAFVEK